ncbi:uncharacterized protein HMPREF1541_04791 [Cyphellophora europaea CBS 101466]|uniref:TM7S3/TM198-like domain-containing protein n=1 Tax=Cyphellophora europaea (strain CBS 101466) TaxID=1220924 RepID=W2RXW9_CYPE1|nr:uncharacterized protein HMPREF1541_04791 [Cyphellophora europaea CBS 101466]ETN40514.1 hypothetical protein HMPREF1541_04791 [Cyphellophora europaea CBS 101466]
MRCLNLCLLGACLLACHGQSAPELRGLRVRQEPSETSGPPTSSAAATEDGQPSDAPTLGQSDAPETTSASRSAESSRPLDSSTSRNTASPETTESRAEQTLSATTEAPNLGPSQTTDAAASATNDNDEDHVFLPIQPRITPAFGIAGVILILSGVGYSLIGVKHRLAQIFLSNAYLGALAVTVLIDYVMKPPISDAVQGAYFVAAFMTGSIFGGGSLIFKEVTEGFGCLLGGFCLGMWFLCLKPGGLVEDQTGKGIMVGVFCVAVWALSWSHWTRNYGLIGSTSFAGATAFVLGIDCFTRAGLKEFWFYIWELNNNLFPLDTDTYPMTRGMIVELIVIVFASIIGVLSQIKLWRIIRDRRLRRDAVKLDDERRRDVVEEALGRQLERQNDRDRATWEKHYSNTLNAKRSTVLWSEVHPERQVTHIIPYEDKRLSSVETLELSPVPGSKERRLKTGSRIKRESSMTVDAITEEQEAEEARASVERQRALVALDPEPSTKGDASEKAHLPEKPSQEADTLGARVSRGPEVVPLPFRIPKSESEASLFPSIASTKSQHLQEPKDAKKLSKRHSLRSLLSLSPRLSSSSDRLRPSESQEHLDPPSRRASRASSLAATLDEDNDVVDLRRISRVPDMNSAPGTPTIVVSPGVAPAEAGKSEDLLNVAYRISAASSTSPEPALELEEDPEELSRPVAPEDKAKAGKDGSTTSHSERRDASDGSETPHTTAPSSIADGLTKGALSQVPSQVSHVVMSYRTNEWAKHIADAEEPIFAEPEQIATEDSEAPVQLAPISGPPAAASTVDSVSPVHPPTVDATRTLSPSSSPPLPHLASAGSDGIVANLQESQRPLSRSATTPVVSSGVPAAVAAPATRPSLKGKRSSTFNKNSIAIKPIQENEVTQFASRSQSRQSSAPIPQRVMSQTHGRPASGMMSPTQVRTPGDRVMAPSQGGSATRMSAVSLSHSHPYELGRNDSYSSFHTASPGTSTPRLSRSGSYMSGVALPQRSSDTRLDSYESRQPPKRDLGGEQQRREMLLTDWRMSQQQGALINQIPQASVESRRAQMLVDREHKRLVEDQARASRQQKQFVMDQVMRRPDMLDLHREKMREMQAAVEKK